MKKVALASRPGRSERERRGLVMAPSLLLRRAVVEVRGGGRFVGTGGPAWRLRRLSASNHGCALRACASVVEEVAGAQRWARAPGHDCEVALLREAPLHVETSLRRNPLASAVLPPNQVTSPDAAAKCCRPGDHLRVGVVVWHRRATVGGGAGEFQPRSTTRLGRGRIFSRNDDEQV